jgi:hypothetical protein
MQDSKSEGAMLKETTNINSSLFNLGKVSTPVKASPARGAVACKQAAM